MKWNMLSGSKRNLTTTVRFNKCNDIALNRLLKLVDTSPKFVNYGVFEHTYKSTIMFTGNYK